MLHLLHVIAAVFFAQAYADYAYPTVWSAATLVNSTVSSPHTQGLSRTISLLRRLSVLEFSDSPSTYMQVPYMDGKTDLKVMFDTPTGYALLKLTLRQ